MLKSGKLREVRSEGAADFISLFAEICPRRASVYKVRMIGTVDTDSKGRTVRT